MLQTVLIVDDEEDVVDLVTFHVRSAGYLVEVAMDGKQALDKARSVLPDLIILDRMLPELDGMTVCQILRCLPSTADIPILMLTAHGSDTARMIALNSGVNDYMMKPFSPRDLMARIKQLLNPNAADPLVDADVN